MSTPLALLVDFDGTACDADVANEVLTRFGMSGWERHDNAVASGGETVREAIDAQAAMLRGTRTEMLQFVLGRYAVSPSFVELCRWAEARAYPLVVASDGFGFYVGPMLAVAGLTRVRWISNELTEGPSGWRLQHPHGHQLCIGCGTCKVRAVQELQRDGRCVAFVGNGLSDRYAAHYADVVFAREPLAGICARAGIPAHDWDTFADVRSVLEAADLTDRRPGPDVCPGWTLESQAAG